MFLILQVGYVTHQSWLLESRKLTVTRWCLCDQREPSWGRDYVAKTRYINLATVHHHCPHGILRIEQYFYLLGILLCSNLVNTVYTTATVLAP